jgi:hypothetical protein
LVFERSQARKKPRYIKRGILYLLSSLASTMAACVDVRASLNSCTPWVSIARPALKTQRAKLMYIKRCQDELGVPDCQTIAITILSTLLGFLKAGMALQGAFELPMCWRSALALGLVYLARTSYFSFYWQHVANTPFLRRGLSSSSRLTLCCTCFFGFDAQSFAAASNGA